MNRVLIIGTERRGISLLQHLLQMKQIEVAAIIDCNLQEKSKAAAFGVPVDTDWKPWLERDIDIIFETTGSKPLQRKLERTKHEETLLLSGKEIETASGMFFLDKESREQLGGFPLIHVLDRLPAALMVADRRGEVRLVNEQLGKLQGPDLTTDQLYKIMDLAEILKSRKPGISCKRIILNGEKWLVSRFPLFDEQEKLAGAVAICREMDELTSLMEQFSEAGELASLLDGFLGMLHEGYAVTDENGVCRYANDAFFNMTGMEPKEVLNQEVAPLAPSHKQVFKSRRRVAGLKADFGQGGRTFQVEGFPVLLHRKMKGGIFCVREDTGQALTEELERSRQIIRSMESAFMFKDIVCLSPVMKLPVEQARIASKTSVPVLVRGERGTGKRRLARAIHHESPRRHNRLAVLPCAALSAKEMEHCLFGTENMPGRNSQKSLLEQAHSGTLLIEDADLLPVILQERLLGEMEENGRSLDIRLIVSTAANLEHAVTEGTFSESLYYYLNRMPLFVPPLRTRTEDMTELTTKLLRKLNGKYQMGLVSIDPQAMNALMSHRWPGNLPELENKLEQACILADKSERVLDLAHFPDFLPAAAGEEQGNMANLSLQDAVEQFERKLIDEAYRKNGFNKTKTAQALNVSIRNLYYKMEKYQIEKDNMQQSSYKSEK